MSPVQVGRVHVVAESVRQDAIVGQVLLALALSRRQRPRLLFRGRGRGAQGPGRLCNVLNGLIIISSNIVPKCLCTKF